MNVQSLVETLTLIKKLCVFMWIGYNWLILKLNIGPNTA